MKYFIILTLLFFISCKSQNGKSTKVLNNQLPAYHIENSSNEKSVIGSIINSSNFESFQVVIFNKKEYRIKDAKKILDTLGKGYSFNVKLDSLSNRKLLIIYKSL
jgi:hypothetical protein